MDYSREFLKRHNVFRYRMKKIEDMSESEVSKVCHWFCEENNLTSEFKDFIQQMDKEKGIRYCLCVQESIDANRCNTIQMIAKQLIDPLDCQDCILNADEISVICSECKFGWK